MKRNIYSIVLLAVIFIAMSGCRKYLDVNQNPNIATGQNLTPELLLPSAQAQIATALGVDLQINGSIWSQYWTQSTSASQYRYLEQYAATASNYDRVWGLLFNGALADLRQLELIAAQTNQRSYIGVAKILEAYTFQLLTDGWGDIPFTEALQGLQSQGGVTSPKYDPQEVVYDGIFRLLDEGLANLDSNMSTHQISTGDVIYGGDLELWQKFGYTLKLRALLRLSEVNPGKAQSGIQALYAQSGGNFLENGEDAQMTFISTPGNQNPLYSEMVGLRRTQNLVASATVVDSMLNNNDERVFEFFTVVGGTVRGLEQGNFNANTAISTLSLPSPQVAGVAANAASAEAPVKFLTGYESYFLQAEAAARNWGPGNAAQLFEQGIIANFNAYNLPDSAAEFYMANSYWGQYPGGSIQENVRHIITQKWFSMTGNQGYEAWNEWRRTGYPDFLVYSMGSIIGNNFPQRFLYPNTEVTRNLNFPGQATITQRVWWDVADNNQ
jgi:hypothetical protein